MTTPKSVLEVRDLAVEFADGGRRRTRAVDGVTLAVGDGDTLGLVGESGSGKSTIGHAVLGLVRPTSGTICYRGEDITHRSERSRRALSRELQIVFQDPYSSLNPSRTIGSTLAEPLRVHFRSATRANGAERVATVLEDVGLSPDAARRYPAQFSGGQRQRIAIARALIVEPRLIVCDEPTSALDLSVQAQILNLLLALQQRHQLSYLFISHDIDVVRHMAHRIAVLRRGQVVEDGPADAVTARPSHPYTRSLLAAVPVPDPTARSIVEAQP